MILPSLLLAFWIIGYPIYDVVMAATHEVNRFGKLKDFVGFGNFRDARRRSDLLGVALAYFDLDGRCGRRHASFYCPCRLRSS